MAEVAPTILADNPKDYAARVERVEPFAKRLHIDICDGLFTETKTVGIAQAYGVEGVPLDLHLMVNHAEAHMEDILSHQPSLVIIHFEAVCDREFVFRELKAVDVKIGLAILPDTTIEQVEGILPDIDHLLVFTGTLGYNGGEFRRDCLEKIEQARAINPNLEIGVDGGINQVTGRVAIEAGANVLNSGAFIHESADPEMAYVALQAIAEGAV